MSVQEMLSCNASNWWQVIFLPTQYQHLVAKAKCLVLAAELTGGNC